MNTDRILTSSKGSASLVAMILAVVAAGVVDIAIRTRAQSRTEALSYRSQTATVALSDQLKLYSSMGSTFRTSLTPSLAGSINKKLADCVLGSTGNCQSGTEFPLTLYFPLEQNGHLLSGDQNSPARFDLYGNYCQSTENLWSARCPFEVYSTFIATCPEAAPTCDRAQSLRVNFKIRAPDPAIIVGAKSLTSENLLTKSLLGTSVSVDSILPMKIGTPANNVTILAFQTEGAGGAASIILTALGDLTWRDPDTATKIQQALLTSGITDTQVLQALSQARYTDSEFARNVGNAILANGVSDPNIIQVLAISGIYDTALVGQKAAEIKNANLPIQTLRGASIAGAIAATDVSDPQQIHDIFNAINNHYDGDDIEVYNIAAKMKVTTAEGVLAAQAEADRQNIEWYQSQATSTTPGISTPGSTSQTDTTLPPTPPVEVTLIKTCTGSQCATPF